MVTLISSDKLFLGCINLRTGIIIEICCFNWLIVAMFIYQYVSVLGWGGTAFSKPGEDRIQKFSGERYASCISFTPPAIVSLAKAIAGVTTYFKYNFALHRYDIFCRLQAVFVYAETLRTLTWVAWLFLWYDFAIYVVFLGSLWYLLLMDFCYLRMLEQEFRFHTYMDFMKQRVIKRRQAVIN